METCLMDWIGSCQCVSFISSSDTFLLKVQFMQYMKSWVRA